MMQGPPGPAQVLLRMSLVAETGPSLRARTPPCQDVEADMP